MYFIDIFRKIYLCIFTQFSRTNEGKFVVWWSLIMLNYWETSSVSTFRNFLAVQTLAVEYLENKIILWETSYSWSNTGSKFIELANALSLKHAVRKFIPLKYIINNINISCNDSQLLAKFNSCTFINNILLNISIFLKIPFIWKQFCV